MKKIIFFLICIALSFHSIGQVSSMDRNNEFRLSIGRYLADYGDHVNFYGSFAYSRIINKWAIGGQTGFRYDARGNYSNYSGRPGNLLGKTDNFQTSYAFDNSLLLSTDIGDIKPDFKEERYFQTFLHLFVERNFRFFNHFYGSLAIGPSVEYGDVIFPAQEQPAKVSGYYGKDIEVYLYDFLMHRYIAFGFMFQGRLKYDFGNVSIGPGGEFSEYPNGNRIFSAFIEATFKF